MTQKAPMVGGMILSALATIASFLPYLAIYLIIQEIVGAYPDFDALDVPKVLGFGGLALGGVLLNVLLYTASVAFSHIAAYGTLYQCKINYVSHVTKLPLGYHLKMGSGRLRKIMDDNIESLEGFIAHDLPNMISAFTAPVVMLVLVARIVIPCAFCLPVSPIARCKNPRRSSLRLQFLHRTLGKTFCALCTSSYDTVY